MGPFELIKLPDYAAGIIPNTDGKLTSRSTTSDVISTVSKSIEYFADSYGIKISLPSLSKNLPGIIVEDYSNTNQSSEGEIEFYYYLQ